MNKFRIAWQRRRLRQLKIERRLGLEDDGLSEGWRLFIADCISECEIRLRGMGVPEADIAAVADYEAPPYRMLGIASIFAVLGIVVTLIFIAYRGSL